MHVEPNRLPSALLSDSLARLLALRLSLLKVVLVDAQSELFGHEHRQVDGEAVGVVQAPDVGSCELGGTRSLGGLDVRLEEPLSAIERARERLLLLVEDLLEIFELAVDFGEEVSLRGSWLEVSLRRGAGAEKDGPSER